MEGVPDEGRGVGTRWSLKSLCKPFYDSIKRSNPFYLTWCRVPASKSVSLSQHVKTPKIYLPICLKEAVHLFRVPYGNMSSFDQRLLQYTRNLQNITIVLSLKFRQGFLEAQTFLPFFFPPTRKIVVKEKCLWSSVIKFNLHLAARECILKNSNRLSAVFENNINNLLPFYSTMFDHALLFLLLLFETHYILWLYI